MSRRGSPAVSPKPSQVQLPDLPVDVHESVEIGKAHEVTRFTGLRQRWFMIGKALLTGFGFMCDAYDLFVINLILAIMQYLYPQSSSDSSLVAACVVIGAVVGQLFFGALGDRFGRKPSLIITFCLLVFGSVASAALSWPFPGFGIYACLALWRFILGFGIGGEYPLSATASSEQSSSLNHVAFTFSMQGMGNLLAPVTVTVLLLIFSSGSGPVCVVIVIVLYMFICSVVALLVLISLFYLFIYYLFIIVIIVIIVIVIIITITVVIVVV